MRHLIETTRFPYRVIAERTGVDRGTVSRWRAKHGWTRPPGAWPAQPRQAAPGQATGRVLARRCYVEAERLLVAVNGAPTVDPAALSEALRLLREARGLQRDFRGRRLVQPAPDPKPARSKPELDPVTRQHIRETRQMAARKAWATRRANQAKLPKRMPLGSAGEPGLSIRALHRRDRDLPSPHLPHVTKPSIPRATWDRRAAALAGWKHRRTHMREAGLKAWKNDA